MLSCAGDWRELWGSVGSCKSCPAEAVQKEDGTLARFSVAYLALQFLFGYVYTSLDPCVGQWRRYSSLGDTRRIALIVGPAPVSRPVKTLDFGLKESF